MQIQGLMHYLIKSSYSKKLISKHLLKKVTFRFSQHLYKIHRRPSPIPNPPRIHIQIKLESTKTLKLPR